MALNSLYCADVPLSNYSLAIVFWESVSPVSYVLFYILFASNQTR